MEIFGMDIDLFDLLNYCGYKLENNELVPNGNYDPIPYKGILKSKLTLADIEKKIVDKKFTILEDGKTTICNLYLQNGFTVRGESACVDPSNFDKNIGEKIAYENAVDKVWQLEGYLLQENLYRAGLIS